MKFLVLILAFQVAFGAEGGANVGEGAKENGKGAVAVAYLEAQAKDPTVVVVPGGVDVVGSAVDSVGMVAVDQKQEERDVDLGEEEEPPLKQDGAASAPLEKNQEKEQIRAWQLQHQEWCRHFESTQGQMVQELLGLQALQNYHPCDQQPDFAQDILADKHIQTNQMLN